VLEGPPPLGPGAAPTERVEAFLQAYLDYCERNIDLVRMSETASPGARYRIGSYWFWHRHLAILLSQRRESLDGPSGDSCPASPGSLAHVLLAPVAADVLAGLGPAAWPAHRAAVCEVAVRVMAS
jgi:hypothetical protein